MGRYGKVGPSGMKGHYNMYKCTSEAAVWDLIKYSIVYFINNSISGVKGDTGDPGPRGPNGDPGEILYYLIQFIGQTVAGINRNIW